MIQELKTNNNCSTCAHSDVCAYKSLFKDAYEYTKDDSILDALKDSPIQLSASCKAYHSTLAHFAKTNPAGIARSGDGMMATEIIQNDDLPVQLRQSLTSSNLYKA